MLLRFVNLKSRDVVCIICIRTSFSELFIISVLTDHLLYARHSTVLNYPVRVLTLWL